MQYYGVGVKEHLKRLCIGVGVLGIFAIASLAAMWVWENYGETLSLVGAVVFIVSFGIFAAYALGSAIVELSGDYRD